MENESKKELYDLMREQMTFEMQSSIHYLAISAWFDLNEYSGFALFFRVQADEERGHAMRIYNFLLDIGQEPGFSAINPLGVVSVIDGPVSAVEHVMTIEKSNTRQIEALMTLVKKESHHRLESFLKWFVDEQVEEERWASELLTKVTRCADSPAAMQMLDEEWGAKATSPAQEVSPTE